MSFLLLREFFFFYIFLFYAYAYFCVDEELVIFLIITLWVVIALTVAVKAIISFFKESVEDLFVEYYFFQDRKNMVLAIYKDQYKNFLNINKFLYDFFYYFRNHINMMVNFKVLFFFQISSLYFSEIINFYKSSYKTMLTVCYLHSFLYLHALFIEGVLAFGGLKNAMAEYYYTNFAHLIDKSKFVKFYGREKIEALHHFSWYNEKLLDETLVSSYTELESPVSLMPSFYNVYISYRAGGKMFRAEATRYLAAICFYSVSKDNRYLTEGFTEEDLSD